VKVNWALVSYGTLAVLNLMLTAFAVELGAGRVPIPAEAQWVVPVLVAGLTGATMLLPRLRLTAGGSAQVTVDTAISESES